MNTKRTALTVASAGTAAGVVGLVLLATPAGAGEPPPSLPPVTAEALVQSVLTAQPPAMSGSVEVKEDLGLPVPVIPAALGTDGARVYGDGQGRARISLPDHNAETTIVADGTTLWIWDSAERSVRKMPHGTADGPAQADKRLADPAVAAKDLVAAMQEDSTVLVDGTARVAGRAAYRLVLTPKPTEKTLLREVRVAVDSELRIPLEFEVLANGQSQPALKIGFTEFSAGAQDPSLFQFTPPQGATVTERKPGEHFDDKAAKDLFAQLDAQTIGQGWDVVLYSKAPAELLSAPAGQEGGESMTAISLLQQFGKQVSGPYGTGWVINARVGTALITQDGRVVLGAVPEQVLVDALGQVK